MKQTEPLTGAERSLLGTLHTARCVLRLAFLVTKPPLGIGRNTILTTSDFFLMHENLQVKVCTPEANIRKGVLGGKKLYFY